MKNALLWSSCVLLLLFASCSKEAQTTLAISAHNWVVTSSSPGGTPGDEYRFYDNRLYMHFQNGVLLNDGQWSYYGYGVQNFINIDYSDLGQYSYEIKNITDTELELRQIEPYSIPSIKLTPKQ